MARLSAALDMVGHALAHDIRSPLRAIDGYSYHIATSQPELSPTSLDNLARLRQAAVGMGRTLTRLLDLIGVERASLNRSRVDLTALVKDLAAELGRGRPDVSLQLCLAEGLAVTADQRLLRRLLHELLDNTWKFAARTRELVVELGRNDVGELYLRDNGVGFDPEFLPRVFEPFQRLHAWGRFDGEGMGLAIVERIVARHGGRVRAESEPDLGTTIFFVLPDAREQPASGSATRSGSGPSAPA